MSDNHSRQSANIQNRGSEMIEVKVVGGVGKKTSNGGCQFYLQNRIYYGTIAVAIATCSNPYYLIEERRTDEIQNQKTDPK